MSESYIFRREDNGQTVDVDWETMMQQYAGFITLADGIQARRVYCEEELTQIEIPIPQTNGREPPIVSDALGFSQHQLADFEADRRAHGFAGVEFTRDPHEPTFFQARFSSPQEWRAYMKHRGMTDNNSKNGGGAALSPSLLERAAQRLLEGDLPNDS